MKGVLNRCRHSHYNECILDCVLAPCLNGQVSLPSVHNRGRAMDPLTQPQEDVLADVLQSIHLHSTLYCRAHLGAPWGIGVTHRDEVAIFHIVTEGTCWLTVEGTDQPMELRAGDLVILPHGHAHRVTDQPHTPAMVFEEFVAEHPPDRHGQAYG